MQIIQRINIEQDFWKLNPEAKYVFHFIKHDEESSKLLWAYTLMYHPRSAFFEMSVSDRLENTQLYLGDEKWHPENDEKLNKVFLDSCLTRLQRNTIKWGDKVDERTDFMDATEYNASTVDMLEKMMGNTKKVQDAYRDALAEMMQEEEESTFGGINESASELGWLD